MGEHPGRRTLLDRRQDDWNRHGQPATVDAHSPLMPADEPADPPARRLVLL